MAISSRVSHGKNRSGGGAGILFHNSFDASLMDGKEHDSFEFWDWILKTTSTLLLFTALPAPPYLYFLTSFCRISCYC